VDQILDGQDQLFAEACQQLQIYSTQRERQEVQRGRCTNVQNRFFENLPLLSMSFDNMGMSPVTQTEKYNSHSS
jgi:hypothetical protein